MIVALALLTGCAGGSPSHPTSHATKIALPTPSAGPTGSVTATPRVTPSAAVVPLPADALFRVTGTATEPDGAVADLVETVYAPAPLTAAESAAITSTCVEQGWPQNYPAPTAVRGTVVAALHPGSKPWTSQSPVGVGPNLGNLSWWSGQFAPGSGVYCTAPGALAVPGTTTGVEPVSPASSPAGVSGGMGWYNAVYGFAMTYDGDDPDGPAASLRVTLSNCAIEVSPLAIAGNPAVASWPTETQPDLGYACWFGPVD